MGDMKIPLSDDRDYLDEFGDLDTAIEMVRGLNEELDAPDDPAAVVRELRARLATEQAVRDVRTGCMTLIVFVGAMFGEPPPLDFVPAAVRTLRRIDEVPDEVLPMVAGGFTAAFLGMSPNEWRDGLGPVSRTESLAWLYAAWSLINFADSLWGGKGTTFKKLDEMVNLALDSDQEGESGRGK
ncbi:hypothetical protein [Actinomadura rubrisoli]|uniref:Uncharacterized protein n=1 Tax=Actinomadura rubrisoli TaxID=2530368 RepID=A0A4R5B6Z6_9ACTN|nr:hypothetical protein [Actinomadura rubrisoli]TDD79042.1 hypothetical protein E1298_28600 [Actinomadura rubrisoli]